MVETIRPDAGQSEGDRRHRRWAPRWPNATVFVIAVAAGVTAAIGGASPTGSTGFDSMIVVAGVAATTWLGARAPSMLVGAAGLITMAGTSPASLATGGAAVVLTGVIRFRFEEDADGLDAGHVLVVRAIAVGLVCNGLIRSDLDGFHGLSAVIGISTAMVLAAAGAVRSPRRVRLVVGLVGATIVAAGLVIAAASVASVASALSTARDASEAARTGTKAVEDGEYLEAAQHFETAAHRFGEVADRFDERVVRAGYAIPAYAQNLRAVDELADKSAESFAAAAASLRRIDEIDFGAGPGTIDLAAVEQAGTELSDLETILGEFETALDDVESPWLIAPLRDEIDESRVDIEEQGDRLAHAVDVIAVAPSLLGETEPRRYLLMFVTPAEARGVGGFMGNFAELEADDGRLEVIRFGRRSDLDDQLSANGGGPCSGCSDEMLAAYGDYGLTTGADGGVGERPWAYVTMPADFPTVAKAAASLYPASGGRPVDGVIAIDPWVVQALMTYTGPIRVDELDRNVRPGRAADFILSEQYVLAGDRADRIAALDTLGTTVIARLLVGELPPVTELASRVRPLVGERRLSAWTTNDDERAALAGVGLLGALPPPAPTAFSATASNLGGSKIDVYLARDFDIRVENGPDGNVLVATTRFTNSSPATGLPWVVIGNEVGLPAGTSRLRIGLYGPARPSDVSVDGSPIDVVTFTEVGYTGVEHIVDLAAGQTVEYVATYPLAPDAASSGAVEPAWLQPLATR